MAAAARLACVPLTARKRFSVAEDIWLIQEVLAANPFANPEKWNLVLENMIALAQRPLTMRGVRERVDLLLSYFRLEDMSNLRK